MPTKQSTIDYLLDQLNGLKEIRTRKMFGEYALYFKEKVVAFVCDDEVFLKITEPGKKLLGKNYQEGFPYPGAKPYIKIAGDLLEEKVLLKQLILDSAEALPKQKTGK